MNRIRISATALAAILFAGTTGAAAIAQEGPGYNPDITRREIANFDGYLDNHPDVARQLSANPALVNNPQFLANHPSLRSFLGDHPGVREEIHESPGQFLYREGRYEWRENRYEHRARITPDEVARFDNGFLDEHPEVAEQLAHDPRLVDNSKYLAAHPGLKRYLASHPGIRTELQRHPGRFLAAERRYERWENRRRPHRPEDGFKRWPGPAIPRQTDFRNQGSRNEWRSYRTHGWRRTF